MNNYIQTIFLILSSIFLYSCEGLQNKTNDNLSDNYSEISVDPQKINFGDLNKNKRRFVTVAFNVYNNSVNEINVKKVDVSCGCMKPLVKTFKLQPHESKEIQIQINLEHQKGKFDKRVFIRSDTHKKVNTVRIIGNVE